MVIKLCEVVDCKNPATIEDYVDSGRYKVGVCQEHYDEKHKDSTCSYCGSTGWHDCPEGRRSMKA